MEDTRVLVRKDTEGVVVKENDVVENWQGRRCVAKTVDGKIVLDDGNGVFRTPVLIIGTTETVPEAEIVKQPTRPAWYRR